MQFYVWSTYNLWRFDLLKLWPSFSSFFRFGFALSKRFFVNFWWHVWCQLEFLSSKICVESSARGKSSHIAKHLRFRDFFRASEYFRFFGHRNSSSAFSLQIFHSFQFMFIQLTFLINTSRNNKRTFWCIQSAYQTFQTSEPKK